MVLVLQEGHTTLLSLQGAYMGEPESTRTQTISVKSRSSPIDRYTHNTVHVQIQVVNLESIGVRQRYVHR